MKTITRFAAALLAVLGLSAPLLAEPAASWVNFSGGIDNGGTITYYGGNASYAITVTGGTRAADGSYIQLGTPGGSTGSISLTFPENVASGKMVTVIADVQYPSAIENNLVEVVLNETHSIYLKTLSDSKMKFVWKNSPSTSYGTTVAWSPTTRQRVTFAYRGPSDSGDMSQGTTLYLGDAPTAADSDATNLYSSDQSLKAIKIGDGASGLKIYGLYVYATKLVSASEVTTEIAAARAEIVPDVSVSMTRNGVTKDNTIKVATLRKGATSSVADFEATFGTTAARSSANTTNEATTFFKNLWSSCVNTNVKSGYPMVCNKFLNNNSQYYWHLWVPITLEATDVFNEVLPELYPTTSGGENQSNAVNFFNYTISLYKGTVVEGTTAEPIATATGTTSSTLGLNTARAALNNTISGRSGKHTLKIEVTPNTCGNGAYSGIRSVHFFNRTTASRTVSGDTGSWSTDWTGGTPLSGAGVTLNVSDAATLAMDAPASLASLTVNDVSGNGSASLTFSGAQNLFSLATTLNANTDVSDITANLGVVTLASGKTLTIAPSVGYNSLTSGTASSGADNASKLVVNAKTTPLSVKSTDSRSAVLKSFTGVVEFQGAGNNGATVEFGYENGNQAFKPRFIFNGGTHTMKYGCNDNLFSPGGTDEKPTIWVTGGAALAFRVKDLSGWNNSTGAEASVIRVGAESSLELLGNNETTPNESGTGYFRDRILLDSGATVTKSHPKFYFYGGAGNRAQLAMSDNQGTATWNGGFETRGEMKIDVGNASTLTLNGVVSGTDSVTKAGAGTLTLTGNNTKSGQLTISAGTVKLQGDGVWAGPIDNSGILEVEVVNATDKTLSKTLSGTGTVKKSGAGTLTLTGDLSGFTGAYQVDNGTLEVVNTTDKILSNTISGTGTVKKSGAGTLSLTGTISTPVEVAVGTLDLGTNRPTIVGIADEATLKLTATEAELANCAITLPTTLTTAPAKERFTVLGPDHRTPLTLTDEPTIEGSTLTVRLPRTGGLITAPETWSVNWSAAGVSGETVVYVRGGENAETAITVTLDEPLSDYRHIGVIGHVKFVTTTTQATLPTTIVLDRGSVLTANASFVGAYTIPCGATVVLDGTTAIPSSDGTTAITSSSALTVNGTLKTQGKVTLSSTSNTVQSTGTLAIDSGITVLTTLTTTNNAGGIKGKLSIASGATLQCGTGDAPDYNGSPSFEIAGTLEITDSVRWSIPSGATVTLHKGALLTGTGPANGNNFDCAFDFFDGGTITADGDATIEATLGAHKDNKTLTITQAAGTTTITGEVRNALGLSVAGSGTVVYAPAAEVTSTSSPLVVDTGATLQLTPRATFALNGAVSGEGMLVLGDGTTARAFTSTRTYPDVELEDLQSLTVQVKPRATLSLDPGAGNFAFPIATVFDVEKGAELILASGVSFFGVSGEGSCSVTGNYTFGVSGTSSVDYGFPDTAKVLNVATLTVGTDTNTAVTLSIRPFGAIAIAPTKLKVNQNAVIARDSYKDAKADASLSIGATATVTGEGTIELPVTFTKGATLDTVMAAPLLLKGKVTGLIKVKLDTAKAVLSTSSDVEFDRNTQLAFASDDASQKFAGYRFAETVFDTTHTFTVVPPLALPGSLPEAVSGNAAAQDAIYDAVAAMKGFGYNITSVTAVTAQSTSGVAGSTEALALFENLHAQAMHGEKLTEDPKTYEGTVTVYYDFGISQLHVKRASLVNAEDPQLYVLLCAKVATKQDTSTADYASGTKVTLYKGNTAVNTALTLTNEQLEGLGIDVCKGEKWFAVPMANLGVGTHDFTVKAKNTTQAEATP